jgi:hypothetical protein
MFGEAQLNRGREFLSGIRTIMMHVPGLSDNAILKRIERNLIPEQPTDVFAEFGFGDHA